jgi:hypothetical protein
MSKKTSNGNHPPVGGEEFLDALFTKAIEGDWMHVLYLAAFALKEKYEANGCHLSDKETSDLVLAVQFLRLSYDLSTNNKN